MISLSFFIARRFFTTKSKASFISLISKISMIGVGVEVMALVLILSVFNGLENFQKDLFKSFDPDFKITAKDGLWIQQDSLFLDKIKAIKNVNFVIPILEDQGLVKYKGKELVVNLKGVAPSFIQSNRLSKSVVEGGYYLKDSTETNNFALVGLGVFLNLGLSFEDVFEPMEVLYPDHKALKNFALTQNTIRSNTIFPSGVLAVENGFDQQTVVVPLDWMQVLCDKNQEFSAIEIEGKAGFDEKQVKADLQKVVGGTFEVKSREELHATLLQAVHIEKLFVFLIMGFVMFIASFTLFYTLSLLVIEKKKDLKTLLAMGISKPQLFKVFLFLGFLISFSGAIVGLGLGFGLGWLQLTYGFVKMGIQNGILDAYPIKMAASDFVATAILVVFITFLASIFPAKKAVSQTFED